MQSLHAPHSLLWTWCETSTITEPPQAVIVEVFAYNMPIAWNAPCFHQFIGPPAIEAREAFQHGKSKVHYRGETSRVDTALLITPERFRDGITISQFYDRMEK